MPMRRRMARRTGRRTARRTVRRRGAVGMGRRGGVGMRRPMPRGRRRGRGLAAILAVGGTAAVAYKMGKKNAQKVEQHTGKSFDDLSEEELGTAMEELNIDLPEDDDGGDLAEYPEEPDEPDYIAELERLGDLKAKGIISEEDFEAKKKQLLGL